MIYDKLRKLPKVIQMDIYESGDLTLLTDDETTPIEKLVEVWSKLEEEFNRKYNKKGVDEVFNVQKEIEYQENRYFIITSCCEQLLFEKTAEIVNLLKEQGYFFNEYATDFKSEIEKIHRESKGIQIKINQLKNKLPKVEEGKVFENNIIDVMASYSSVLNVPFDFNTISVEAFHAYESQVKAKIKNIEKQIAQQKTKK
jgi:hypothetical protein